MPLQIDVDGHHTVGQAVHFESYADDGKSAVVFRDDGESGYFFALDPLAAGDKIQDALYIYHAADVAPNERLANFSVGWSDDGRKSVLLINGVPQAVFDFSAKRGYCRSGLPEAQPDSSWSQAGHAWSDDTAKLFR